jgi:ABC-2 type transport system permease protein
MKQLGCKDFENNSLLIVMTFLQQTLGPHYKWLYIILFGYKLGNSSPLIRIINIVSILIVSLTILSVWKIGNASSDVFTYLVVGRIFKTIVDTFVYYGLGSDILNGKITTALIRPTGQFAYNLYNNLGKRIPINFIQIIASLIVIPICLKFYSNIEFDFLRSVLLVLFIPSAFLTNYLVGYIIGAMSFYSKDEGTYASFTRAHEAMNNILVGLIIPLDKLIFLPFVVYLPQAWILHHPMQIYLGKYSQIEIRYIFTGGIAWCLVLWILARLVFKAGLKRNEAVGL